MKLASILFISLLSKTIFAAEFITIGTGGIMGNYYQTGGVLCKFVNKYKQEMRIRCSVESTSGSVHNIDGIKNGRFDFAIVQNDVVYQASNAIGQYKNKAVKKLKTVMSIYPELLTLVTSDNVNNKIVYNVAKAILENFSDFKKLNPTYENITKRSLLKGLNAPLHEGAKKYYKEIGILYK